MSLLIEISIILGLIVVQSVFGVGLLLFGTPSFLLLGYDFASTINILMPVSILISFLQFTRSKIIDRKFIFEYNLFCLPFLALFLILALNYRLIIDFKFFVALLLVFSSLLILNKSKFSSFKTNFFQFKNILSLSKNFLQHKRQKFFKIYKCYSFVVWNNYYFILLKLI